MRTGGTFAHLRACGNAQAVRPGGLSSIILTGAVCVSVVLTAREARRIEGLLVLA